MTVTTTDNPIEELKRITDPKLGAVVQAVTAHIDRRFDVLESKLEKREKDWGKRLHRLLSWLASQFSE